MRVSDGDRNLNSFKINVVGQNTYSAIMARWNSIFSSHFISLVAKVKVKVIPFDEYKLRIMNRPAHTAGCPQAG